MSIIEKLKTESLRLRRDMGHLGKFSVFVLSEIEKVGKNNGNRQTTDDEAIAVIKKIISNIQSNIAVVSNDYNTAKMKAEINLLESVLPAMISDDELKLFINGFQFQEGFKPNKGIFMKSIKEKYGSLVDMKKATIFIKEIYDV